MSTQILRQFLNFTTADTRRPAPTARSLASSRAAADPDDTWRYERKYFLRSISADDAELLIRFNPRYFRQVYPDRYINNIYLDSESLRCYWENVEGVNPRFKQRIRWYGDLHQDNAAATLEIKRKYSAVGDKLRVPLGEFNSAEAIHNDGVAALLKTAVSDRRFLSHGDGFKCVLVNRYLRRYYASFDGLFRATLDRELQFYPAGKGPGVSNLAEGENVAIVEIKYARDHDCLAKKVLENFPFRPTRISKYVYGVDLLRSRYYL
jgi:VTC domain